MDNKADIFLIEKETRRLRELYSAPEHWETIKVLVREMKLSPDPTTYQMKLSLIYLHSLELARKANCVSPDDIDRAKKERRDNSIWLTVELAEKYGYVFEKVDEGWLIKRTKYGNESYAGTELQFFAMQAFCTPFPNDYLARLALAKHLERHRKERYGNR